jgi:hypothetical protein
MQIIYKYWIGLAQDKEKWRAGVNAAMNLSVPSNAAKLSSSYTRGELSCIAQFHRVSYYMNIITPRKDVVLLN